MHNIISDKILAWYDQTARVFPWRISPNLSKKGILPNPYHVWLSEIMLQQTTTTAVIPYFEYFIKCWHTVSDLAYADNNDVMNQWAGLGYYSRARNLHKCAKIITDEYQGIFPSDIKTLKSLCGIGDYTAAAISSIAFGQRAVVVDGNIERIVSRLYVIDDLPPHAKKIIYDYADKITPHHRAGDYAQAMMDLGATICTPKNPKCDLCPIAEDCQAFKKNTQTQYPRKLPKKTKPHRYGVAVMIFDDNNHIIIQKNPDSGLFGGLFVLPYRDDLKNAVFVHENTSQKNGKSVDNHVNNQWINKIIHNITYCNKNKKYDNYNTDNILSSLVDNNVENDMSISNQKHTKHYYLGCVKHIFTHFSLSLDIVVLKKINPNLLMGQQKISYEQRKNFAFPSLMQKVFTLFDKKSESDLKKMQSDLFYCDM